MSKAQKTKAIQNYEQNPPRCSSCENYRREQKASPETVVMGVVMQPKLAYLPAHCFIGSFAVSPGGICDLWVHKVTGEVLIEE